MCSQGQGNRRRGRVLRLHHRAAAGRVRHLRRGRAHRHHRGQAGGAGPGHEPVASGRGVRDQGHRPDAPARRARATRRSPARTSWSITAGLPRKPGMSRMDLIEINAKIVRNVVENVAKYAPDAVLIVVSNPLDEMTALAAKVSGFPSARVMGQAGMLDTARFSYFVAEKLAVPVGSVRTLTLGSHGDTMVPVPSACTVDGQPLAGPAARGGDRGAGPPDQERRRRDRRAAQDRLGVLRPVGRRGPDGPRGGRGLRRGHAGLRLGGRRVRHLRRLPGRRGRDRRGRRPPGRRARPDRGSSWPACATAAEAVRAKQADVASL